MKQFTVAAVNGGMISHRCAEAEQQDIARLCRGQGHPVKAGDRHIVQVKVLTVAPPVILTLKIRHINSRQMVGIPEQRVTVRHPVFKTTPGQVRHTAEFMNVPPADQPPGQGTFYLQPPVGLAQPGQATGMAVDQCHNLPCISARSQSSGQYENMPQALQRYSRTAGTGHPPACLSRSRKTPQAHTAGHAPESLILSLSWIYCESLLMERKPPKLTAMPRISHPRMHLLHLSLRISVVGLSNSSATAGPLYPHSSPR